MSKKHSPSKILPSAFTMVELMVTVAILGILAGRIASFRRRTCHRLRRGSLTPAEVQVWREKASRLAAIGDEIGPIRCDNGEAGTRGGKRAVPRGAG